MALEANRHLILSGDTDRCLAEEAARDSSSSGHHLAEDYSDVGEHHSLLQVDNRVRIRIPTLCRSPIKVETNLSQIFNLTKLQRVEATL